ncbi:MAG: ribonuclease III [Planctomycetes bacterium]|nr:ribonuclease III [Planctomycetota bacterium]
MPPALHAVLAPVLDGGAIGPWFIFSGTCTRCVHVCAHCSDELRTICFASPVRKTVLILCGPAHGELREGFSNPWEVRHGPVRSPDVPQSELLNRAQELAGHRFADIDLLVSAVTHASLADCRLSSNERLEFLGDAILGVIACEELFLRYPNKLEGEMTKVKSVVVSRKVCAHIADDIGLSDLLRLGKGMTESNSVPSSVRAGVLEAFIAALYLDAGLAATKAFLVPHLVKHIERMVDSKNMDNHKSSLQQYAQKHLSATPKYEALDEKGPDHSKCFEVAVVIASRRFGSAWAPNKKEAEQQAALLALRELGIVDADEE